VEVKSRNSTPWLTTREGVYRVDFYLPDGTRFRKSLATKDKQVALVEGSKVYADALKEHQTRPVGIPKAAKGKVTITLKDAYKRAMAERRQWRDSKSPRSLEGNYKLICDEFGDDADLSTFTYKRMLKYAEKLREAGTSKSSINQRLSMISVMIELAAHRWDLPLVPYKMPREKPAKGRIRIVTVKEEEAAIAYFRMTSGPKSKFYYHRDMVDFVPCLLDTGFRLSELTNVNAERDIDWKEGTIAVWDNKADHPRVIPMTDRVKEIMHRRKDYGKPFGMLDVFNAGDAWDRFKAHIGLSEDKEFVLHALRHTTASRLAAAGMDAFRIQKYMGHKSIVTTQIYVTLFANDLRSLTAVLNRRAA
jgi:integrase